ncbi:MAG: phage terminase large subunit [Polaromonas sp.]|nr:phage terminase large subunit [Polaromonas sp.]
MTARVRTTARLTPEKPPVQRKVKPKPINCTFHQFFAVWAGMQTPAWAIPDFHIDILDFLSDYRNWDNHTGLVQVFRGAAKSTIVGLFITWMLTQDPTLRFLVLSADKKIAMKITMDVASIIQRHPLAKHLHGKENTWRSDTLVVAGATDGRTPSVTSWGVGSNVTGSRADWVIYDDTEVPNNSGTDGERQQLRLRLIEPTHILATGGYELFVGTPHSFDSIYTELEGVSGATEPFRTGCSSIKIPIMDEATGEFPNMTGIPKWPEKFSEHEIAKRQGGSSTKGNFLSQYLLLPYNPMETVLDPTLIATYNYEIDIHQANGATVARLNGVRVMGVSAFWDPASSELGKDDSVFAAVFTTDDGQYYIHRAQKVNGDLDEQIAEVIRLMLALDISHVNIETNGPGNFLVPLFRKAATGKGVTCEGRWTSENKKKKIMGAYEHRLNSGALHAHKSVMEGPFRTQLRDFSMKSSKNKDDYIDAVAMAILAQPIRIKSGHRGDRISQWQHDVHGGSQEYEVVPYSF